MLNTRNAITATISRKNVSTRRLLFSSCNPVISQVGGQPCDFALDLAREHP
jgi:hypothetical protein